MNDKRLECLKTSQQVNALIAIDVVGYPLAEACRILEQAGFEVVVVATGSPGPNNGQGVASAAIE